MNNLHSLRNGFTLIEVLVTLIVILIGLLGIAAFQFKGQQVQLEAYQRSQASILLQDMVSRINSNRINRSAYFITSKNSGDNFAGVGKTYDDPTDPIAVTDLSAWSDALEGVAEGSTVGAMIGARGCIWAENAGDDRVITISVAWQGINPTVSRTDNLCATGNYGNETQRRVMSITIRIANLGDS